MEVINKEFNTCPNCGSKRRFLEHLSNEVKKVGMASEQWRGFFYDHRNGVVVDKAKEPMIPIGTALPGYAILTDICLDCGTIYAVRLQSGPVVKSLAKPKLHLPGDDGGHVN